LIVSVTIPEPPSVKAPQLTFAVPSVEYVSVTGLANPVDAGGVPSTITLSVNPLALVAPAPFVVVMAPLSSVVGDAAT
jgi:hypothetical protein